MASNWIKVEVITPDKPEIFRLAETLNIDPDAALGKAIRFWVWADQQTIDGNAKCNANGVTKNAIDRITFMRGFADALIQVGWLYETEGVLTLPNFDRHNGESSKKRALTNRRVTEYRDKKPKGNAKSVTEGDQKALPEEEEEVKEREREAREQPVDNSCPKFSMQPDWLPGDDFAIQSAAWGHDIGVAPGYTSAQLQQFRDYWLPETALKYQSQWEMSFAESLSRQKISSGSTPGAQGVNSIPEPDRTIPTGFRGGTD
ncbi:DnaT-like ssDNA-binding domain-containing protein [Buttiauxella sp. S19-1]|uniref:DnaT-like ssDNA-binding domain-containing protein n=1 Tax=Buttiauxella sp. S19-1 TaxID=941430 RepID=UPI001EDC40EC|nr:DnaT-like ssDNA-binding domain-containing protein [Buttiauxella sp. S19-1]